VKVKICGITTKAALAAAVEAGADFVGFVFFNKSKRNISVEKAKELTEFVPQNVKTVGIFVDEPIESLLKTAEDVGLDIVQLHGNESSDYCKKIGEHIQKIKAIKIIDGEFAQNPCDFSEMPLLLDAQNSGFGEKFDWEKVDLSKIRGREFFVAGGLNCENVVSAIKYFAPFAVDVSSGVETDGIKDIEKIKKFCKTAKGDTANV